MSNPTPIQAPGGFAPVFTLGFEDAEGMCSVISNQRPLPTRPAPAQVPAPLEGSTASSALIGPFEPAALTPVYCTLSGDFEGTVQVVRSTDGGATVHPLTAAGSTWAVFSGPACEAVWQESEDGAALWLDCSLVSGTLEYRLSQ